EADEKAERLGVDGALVVDVARPVLGEGGRGGGVDRLEHERGAGGKLGAGEAEESGEIAGVEVLDNLGGEEAAERGIGNGGERGEGVGLDGVDAERAGGLDHERIEIGAPAFDPLETEHVEELAAAAAEIEDLAGGVAEEVEVDALAAGDLV